MVVVWRVTERCNLSCKFCGYDRELVRPRKDADPQAVLYFGAILAEYQRLTGEAILVSWLGGEPLLWVPLTNLTRAFCQDYQLRVSTTTNGTCLASAGMRAHLLEFYSELTISVDALGSLHDQLRGWHGGFSGLEQYVTDLAEQKRSLKRGPVLRANVLLMRETIADFEPLCFRLANWGIEEITFNQLGGNDRPEFYPAHRLLPQQAEALAIQLPRLRNDLIKMGVRLRGGDSYARRIQATSRGERLPVHDCQPGQRFLFIKESGRVAPCSFTVSGFGVQAEEIISACDLHSLPLRFSELRRQRPSSLCEDCHSTQVFEKFEYAS
jgi:MoaA/NifB/PqqE/SkfB family radical SAM enzyme